MCLVPEEVWGEGIMAPYRELLDVGQILIRMLIGNLQWKSMTKNLFIVQDTEMYKGRMFLSSPSSLVHFFS